MRRTWLAVILTALGLAMLCGCAGIYGSRPAPGYPPPPGNMDVGYFYDALAPYGYWIESGDYGWVWCPTGVPVDWRPYTTGEWVLTDYGWAWVADEDWGWAPFHYGRWYDDRDNGWCWVPGREWAPAWVVWREGGGWIGWAPLPPEIAWSDGGGFAWSDWDNLPGVRHHGWSYCQERDLPGSGLRRRLADRHRSVTLARDTRNVTNYTFVGSHVVNRSLDPDRVRQAYGHDIPMRRVADLTTPPANRGRQLAGETLNAYRPRLREAPADRKPQTIRAVRPAPEPAVVRPVVSPDVVTPRVEPAPRGQTRREEIELERREAAERARLQQEVRKETNQPPPGVNQEQLRRQHAEEQQALEEQTARDQRVLKGRRQQEEQRQPVSKKPPATKARGEREDRRK